jgi:hypothetical protein
VLSAKSLQAWSSAKQAIADDRQAQAGIYAAEERHVLLTTEKIRALIGNIRGKKDRHIEGEVVKKDDDDG